MNIQQLESFIQVAENLSFARAAEVLNMTQSAVSRQISSLENELGASLFHRSTWTVSCADAEYRCRSFIPSSRSSPTGRF